MVWSLFPEEVKGKSLEQIKMEDEVYLTIKKKKLFAKVKEYLDSLEKPAPEKGPGLRTFNVFVDDQYYEVEVECTSGAPMITGIAPMAAPTAVAAPKPAAQRPGRRSRGQACCTDCGSPGRRRSAPQGSHAGYDHQLQRQSRRQGEHRRSGLYPRGHENAEFPHRAGLGNH